MGNRWWSVACAAAAACVLGGGAYADRGVFDGYRLAGAEAFEVRVGDGWYRVEAVNGVDFDELLSYAVWTYGVDWFEEVAEDLPSLIERRTGEPAGGALRVVLSRKGEDGMDLVDRMLEISEEAAERGADSAEEVGGALPACPSWSVRRVERAHSDTVPDYLRDLVRPIRTERMDGDCVLSAEQVARDLDQLEWLIEHCHSYSTLRHCDYRAAFDAIRAAAARGDGGLETRNFRLQVAEVLSCLGDGHTRVLGIRGDLLPGWLPFTVREGRRRVLAVGPDAQPYQEGREAVKSIDGHDIEWWVGIAGRLVADGSLFFERPRAVDLINHIQHLRALAGEPLRDEVDVEFWSFNKQDPETITMPVLHERPERPGRGPAFEQRIIDGGVGYLKVGTMQLASRERIEAMASVAPERASAMVAVEDIHEAMGSFRDTGGLVIDVRGNGGGSRDIVNILVPYFLGPEDGPVVVSAAKYKLRPGDDPHNPIGFLANRWMHPLGWEGWTPAERRVLSEFGETFDPQAGQRPAREGYSGLHVMVVSPPDGGPWYHYKEPVIVLMDWYCYSATDIFLGAMSLLPQVTLAGQPSGGGSGRAITYELGESAMRIKLSSMWSFNPDGMLYDTNGVHPDIGVNRWLTDFLGTSDSLLDQAVSEIVGAGPPEPEG